MNRILLITENENDFGNLLIKTCKNVTVMSPKSKYFDPNEFDALCVLGGDTEEGLILNAPLRICYEKFMTLGKPIFCEFVLSVSSAYISTTFHMTRFFKFQSTKMSTCPTC